MEFKDKMDQPFYSGYTFGPKLYKPIDVFINGSNMGTNITQYDCLFLKNRNTYEEELFCIREDKKVVCPSYNLRNTMCSNSVQTMDKIGATKFLLAKRQNYNLPSHMPRDAFQKTIIWQI